MGEPELVWQGTPIKELSREELEHAYAHVFAAYLRTFEELARVNLRHRDTRKCTGR